MRQVQGQDKTLTCRPGLEPDLVISGHIHSNETNHKSAYELKSESKTPQACRAVTELKTNTSL